MNERKRQVMLAAQRLIIEKGFASTSVQDILEEAKISKGTFYNYFTSKNECLIAILDHAAEESIIRRRDLLVGRDHSDKDLLAKQILIRMHVNRELNLIPVYEAIFHSNDEELRNFVKLRHVEELNWMSGRLIDVYGKKAEPHAVDCSVMILGMIQQLSHFWTVGSPEVLNIEKLVHFAIRRVDAIMFDLIENGDILLGKLMLKSMATTNSTTEDYEKKIHQQLQLIKGKLENGIGHQYIDFLLNELQTGNPQLSIMEVVTRSLRDVGKDTKQASRINEAALLIWDYIDMIKTDK